MYRRSYADLKLTSRTPDGSYYAERPTPEDMSTQNDMDLAPNVRRSPRVYKAMPFRCEPPLHPCNEWQCLERLNVSCTVDDTQFTKVETIWKPYAQPVLYCVSETVHEECQLSLNYQLAIFVILANLAKAICMLLVIWRHKGPVLITIGDAIQSFLDKPDPFTKNMCIYSTDKIRLLFEWQRDEASYLELSGLSLLIMKHTPQTFMNDPKRRQWQPKKRYWTSAVPITRWILCIILYVEKSSVKHTQ